LANKKKQGKKVELQSCRERIQTTSTSKQGGACSPAEEGKDKGQTQRWAREKKKGNVTKEKYEVKKEPRVTSPSLSI